MHELAVTQGILKIALENAEKANAKRITGINLLIGKLSSIVDDSIQFYWDIISQDTPAAGSILHIDRIPVVLKCGDCGKNYSPNSDDGFDCPQCHSARVNVIKGDELRVESIDVE